MIYNLNPDDAWLRAHDYRKGRGLFQNCERMLTCDSPLDFMEDSIDLRFQQNEASLMWAACHPKKESP